MQIKERRTKILLLLYLMNSSSVEGIEITPSIQKIFDLVFNQKTRGTLAGLIKGLLVEKQEEKPSAKITYMLTEKGKQQLYLEFPFFRFVEEEWDGVWRVISYEIPESKRDLRDRLRREMRGWGLGPWHRSFWLTPHPIIEELRSLVYGREEEQYIQAFESTHVFGDVNGLVEKVWQKSELEKNYRELFKQWHGVLSSEKDKSEKIRQVAALYVPVLRADPGVPKSLMGLKWIGFEAFSLFKEIRKILLHS